MTLIVAFQNRGITRDVVINDVADNPITPGGRDLVRVMIGREGETPKLSVTSGTPTANGSSVIIGGGEDTSHRLRLDADDLAFEPGTYTMFLDYFDWIDAREWKNVDRQVFQLHDSEG